MFCRPLLSSSRAGLRFSLCLGNSSIGLWPSGRRGLFSGRRPLTSAEKQQTTLNYTIALAVATVAASYAAVPIYRIFCSATGYGGTVAVDREDNLKEKLKRKEDQKEPRELTVKFNADTASTMMWHFKPVQRSIKVKVGETALAFFTAFNPTSKPVDGISTYNVVPFSAGSYFHKIQCFCFEEQRLNPKEEVELPVFFYVDPEFEDDPLLADVDELTLSYTFFEAKPGLKLPDPFKRLT